MVEMKFEGILNDVTNIIEVLRAIENIHDRAFKNIDMKGSYGSTQSMLSHLKEYGENLTAYSLFNPKNHFMYRSIERNALLIDIKGYCLTFTYDGDREWFIHFLKTVGLHELFNNAVIKDYDPDIEIDFPSQPHLSLTECFIKLDSAKQREIIQKLVSTAANNGEVGDFIRYGSFKTSENEQGVGWFVTSSNYLKGVENNIVKHYFNSKENNIRINTLKEYMALSKSLNRVLRHI